MSAEVLSGDAVAMAGKEGTAAAVAEVESAKCDCCGLTEDYTAAYVARVRERHGGRWICGLCSEAVKEEICRSGWRISTEEAVDRHMSFFKSFRSSSPPANTKELLVAAMTRLIRRSLDSPRGSRSTPSSPSGAAGARRHPLARSDSCFPTLAG